MEHWLPLFEDKMATLFDHLGAGAVIVRDIGVAAANEARFEAIADYHANRVRAQSSDPGSYRPLPADALYLTADEMAAGIEAARAHLATPFHEPERATVLDFAVDGARDFRSEEHTSELQSLMRISSAVFCSKKKKNKYSENDK